MESVDSKSFSESFVTSASRPVPSKRSPQGLKATFISASKSLTLKSTKSHSEEPFGKELSQTQEFYRKKIGGMNPYCGFQKMMMVTMMIKQMLILSIIKIIEVDPYGFSFKEDSKAATMSIYHTQRLHFAQIEYVNEEHQKENFHEYFIKKNLSFEELTKCRDLEILVRKGIPCDLRPEVSLISLISLISFSLSLSNEKQTN